MTVDLPVPGLVGHGALEARLEHAPAWLQQRRELAWRRYTELPLPSSSRDEDWRRTDISALRIEDFVADPGETTHGEALIDAMRAMRDAAAPGAAFVASTRLGNRACEDTDQLTAQGIIVGSLDAAARNHPELVQRGLDTIPPDSAFLALWNALWWGGTFVYVPPSVDARIPVFAAHTAAGDNAAIFPATIVVLDSNSSLTLIDAYASPATDAPLLSNAVSALVIGQGARLDYCTVQRWGAGAWHMATHRATLAKDARLRFFGATLGARLQKAYWEVIADGAGSEALLSGVCFGDGTQHLDHQSLQLHRAPRTHTDLLLKVAVRDRARSVYSGLIEVEREAQQTDAYVQNRNLILSDGAIADSVPRLEIRANDVRCGHGATAGHIDSAQRFYLMSRGVPAEVADRIIVSGFMQDALDRCPHDGVRAFVAQLLDEEIAGRSQAGITAPEVDAA
jgi:Fe-S cluster assembly protein SufD